MIHASPLDQEQTGADRIDMALFRRSYQKLQVVVVAWASIFELLVWVYRRTKSLNYWQGDEAGNGHWHYPFGPIQMAVE